MEVLAGINENFIKDLAWMMGKAVLEPWKVRDSARVYLIMYQDNNERT